MNFGFALPYLLATIPVAAAALVYAYRYDGRRSTLIVASVFLLRDMKKKVIRRAKFRPTPRFFLELLMCLLLGLGAAGFFWTGSGKQVVLVLDTSLSMSANLPGGGTRFEAALAESESYLDRLPMGSMVLPLTSAGGKPEGMLEPRGAVRWLREQVVTRHEDHIDELLHRLPQESSFDEIVVVTDKTGAAGDAQNIQVRSVGRVIAYNFGLQDRGITARAGQGSELKVLVHAYGAAPTGAGRLVVRPWLQGRVVENTIARKEFPLPAGGTSAEVPLVIPKGAEADSYQVTLETADPLQLDNVTWFGRAREEILLVAKESATDLKIESIDGIGVRHIEPASWKPAEAANAQLVVFHGVSLEPPPRTPLLRILTPEATTVTTQEPITSFRSAHPLLRYAEVAGLSMSNFQPLTPPSWGAVLLQTKSGALIVAGEPGGVRQVLFGFELLPFEGKRSPLTSILFLNAVNWLRDGGLRSADNAPDLSAANDGTSIVRFFSADESDATIPHQLVLSAGLIRDIATDKGGFKEMVFVVAMIVLALLVLDSLLFIARGGRSDALRS